MGELVVPQLNSNDVSYVLLEWLVPFAGRVAPGDVVALLETSKTVSDLVVGESGYLAHAVQPSGSCRPGEVVATVWSTVDDAWAAGGPVPAPTPGRPARSQAARGHVVTRSAQEVIDQHGIDPAAVSALGRRVVKRADVLSLVGGSDVTGRPLDAHQRGVAATVIRSHRNIPTAFTVMKVDIAEVLRQATPSADRGRAPAGLVEHVVRAVGRLRPRFPLFFAHVDDETLTVRPAPRADVGVTVDVGTGLYIPVVRDAGSLSLGEIGARLIQMRVAAKRRRVSEADLAGAAIVLSLHLEPGVVFARPIVFPGVTSTLSVTAPQRELRLDPDGRPVHGDFVHCGVAYDHRVLNGADAMAFLAALRDELQEPNA